MTTDPAEPIFIYGPKLSAALFRHGLTISQAARRMTEATDRSPIEVGMVLASAIRDGSCPVTMAFLAQLVAQGLRPVDGLAEELTTP